MARGGQRIGFDVGRWTATGDVARRDLAPAVREQVTARSGAVEWDVVLASRPAGHGDLVLRAGVDGVVGEPKVMAGGRTLRLSLVGGATIGMGETVVVDASGRVLYRALPSIADGRVELVVPDAVLEHAAYPITIDPTVSSGQLVSTPSNLANQPSIAFDGEDYLVAWSEYDGSNFEIRAAQVNGAGTIVQQIGFLSTQGDSRDDQRPAVAWNGTRFLVTWEHTFATGDIDVYGRIVNRAGFPDRLGLLGRRAGRQPDVPIGGGGRRHVLRGVERRPHRRRRHQGCARDECGRGARRGAGRHRGLLRERRDPARHRRDEWRVARELPEPRGVGKPRRLRPANEPVPATDRDGDPARHHRRTRAGRKGGVGRFRLSRGVGRTRRYPGPPGSHGRLAAGRRVIPISTAPDNQSIPDVAFNGAYLVAWKDNRNFWNEIWAARVASDGTVQDPSGFRIFDQATNQGTAGIFAPPSVAAGPGNKWAVDHEAVFGGIFHYSVAPK